ncbi:uncharacterized protein DNG_07163 [Cephalotrichum gorgonifer]|uniref:Pre-rRNA-processing protein RIX1 n=1 Tax=Cephalotrichum gorgonifer TaxID=2041049 RepID=A0AAE8N3R6_9PEZI|nr:uncharacterized protein DNG_07163 [Cephalotrichum gorgonifer]
MSLPPELRLLCQQLTSPSITPAHLAQSSHVLAQHVLQCGAPLSAPQDQKIRETSSESTVLVHKLKTAVKSLLNDRDHRRRYTGVVLVKAIIDVGGWECLRSSEPWVRGLLTIIQKKDPIASKELAIVAVARIYTKLHGGQTLVREIATPTIPGFFTACLQLVKPASEGELPAVPLSVVETIFEAFAAVIPLYPTTTRPFVSKIRTAIRPYLAPTLSDDFLVPEALREASRRLAIALHFTAPKAGGADDWASLLSGNLKQFHSTADQVFRAVQETWEPPAGYTASTIDFGEKPSGGGDGADTLPSWTGITSGAQRLVGLLAFMSDSLRYPTKAQVAIPVGRLVDAVSRVSQIARHSPKTQTWEQALEIKPSVSRDERDELWSVLPGIHTAAIELLLTLRQRLRSGFVPIASEALEYLLRVFKSGIGSASLRLVSYQLLADILPLSGPTMTKDTVSSLELILSACCRDIQQDKGCLSESKPAPTDPKKQGAVTMNADLFLGQGATESSSSSTASTLSPAHISAAERVLSASFEYLPQQHLRPALRGLLDQTAILSRSRDAMFASVLNPFRTQQGRLYPSILPFLSQMYPRDQGLEVLRSNMRSSVPSEGAAPTFKDVEEEEVEEEDVEMGQDEDEDEKAIAEQLEVAEPVKDVFDAVPVVDKTPKVDPFAPRADGGDMMEVEKKAEEEAEHEEVIYAKAPSLLSPPAQKRKSGDDAVPTPAKKINFGRPPEVTVEKTQAPVDGDDDSDDESVNLVASFDSDPEDE